MQVYGIDLSMEKFDVNFFDGSGKATSRIIKNNLAGISKFLEGIPSGSVLCAEHTGVYGDMLLYLCNQAGITICLVPGYTVRHSLGLAKGKSDKVDALRLREYGERFNDKLKAANYGPETIKEIQWLHTLRQELVKARKALLTSRKGCGYQPMQSISVHNHVQSVIEGLNKEISEVDAEIDKLIQADPCMRDNYQLITSIKGIGPVIATDLLIKTGNFEVIDSARKAASYAGVCPFPNSSGKMVGKSKTSPFADKKLKTLLYMGAKAAVKYNKEYRLYYQKKKLEGKAHYLIMNNVSNKMLRTVYSVLKNKIPWSETYICLDPREKNKQLC
ncbi:IS110 family RNA-guided transposase [Dysgonomonas reticulitermitis]|nr:IS110 family transposase [Bacteroidia bacterium]